MKTILRLPLLAVALLLAVSSLGAQTATKPTLTLDVAKRIATGANAVAARNNWTVVIAIVDEGGNLLYLERMDGTQIGSIDVARLKAETAIKFKRSTKALQDGVANGQNQLLSVPGLLPLEGGLPIEIDGQIVGAIGVSGMTSAQDGQVAAGGVAAIPGR